MMDWDFNIREGLLLAACVLVVALLRLLTAKNKTNQDLELTDTQPSNSTLDQRLDPIVTPPNLTQRPPLAAPDLSLPDLPDYKPTLPASNQELQALKREMLSLRQEVNMLKRIIDENAARQMEIETSTSQMLGQFKTALERLEAASIVSPLYHEAVALAQRGSDATSISSRCGISMAEAELVAALTRPERRKS